MANRKPLTDEHGEVRELTEEDIAQFVPFSTLPPALQKVLKSPTIIVPDSDGKPSEEPAA